ncbi:MAG: pyridoxamine 5'-phosphate oxidase family protein [Actinomycetota bacterium]
MTTRPEQVGARVRGEDVIHRIPDGDGRRSEHPGSEQVWRALARASFAVIAWVTPSGEPRSSGVVYKMIGRRMYVAVARDSWKARHIAANGRVAVTVTVRRGGLLSLVFPIPPATISFRGTALVYPANSSQGRSALERLGSLLPKERRDSAAIIEIVPEGTFVTYGVGIPLTKMRDPSIAQARVPK